MSRPCGVDLRSYYVSLGKQNKSELQKVIGIDSGENDRKFRGIRNSVRNMHPSRHIGTSIDLTNNTKVISNYHQYKYTAKSVLRLLFALPCFLFSVSCRIFHEMGLKPAQAGILYRVERLTHLDVINIVRQCAQNSLDSAELSSQRPVIDADCNNIIYVVGQKSDDPVEATARHCLLKWAHRGIA